jgi:hypothetical protein
MALYLHVRHAWELWLTGKLKVLPDPVATARALSIAKHREEERAAEATSTKRDPFAKRPREGARDPPAKRSMFARKTHEDMAKAASAFVGSN